MRRLVLFLLLALAAPATALGQPYPGITPVPRTTDAALLRALANRREILERIRIGFAAERSADWKTAALEFERVISLQPVEPQASTAYYDLGIARAGLGDYGAAVSAFSEAIARDPGFLAARANLVAVRLMQGDLARSRLAADAFVAAAPESARALYARGIVALRAGDAATALSDFAKLSANDSKYAVAHYDLALAERELGRYADAERELRAALELAPRYARAMLALGAVLLREGKRDEARVTFDEAANAAPDIALHNLAVSLRNAIAVKNGSP